MSKVVFVNRFFHPDHSATSQILSDLAFFLAGEGCDVGVVTSRLRYDAADATQLRRLGVGFVVLAPVQQDDGERAPQGDAALGPPPGLGQSAGRDQRNEHGRRRPGSPGDAPRRHAP